jgi:hypothetical protein
VNIERMQYKAKLAEYEKKFKTLDIEASGLIILIRSFLNPYEEDVTKLDVEKTFHSMSRLRDVVNEMKSLEAKIQKMEQDLD